MVFHSVSVEKNNNYTRNRRSGKKQNSFACYHAP